MPGLCAADGPIRSRARWAARRYQDAWKRPSPEMRRLRAFAIAILILVVLLFAAMYGSVYGFFGALLVLLGVAMVLATRTRTPHP